MKSYNYDAYVKDRSYIVRCDVLPKDASVSSKLEIMAQGREKPFIFVPNLPRTSNYKPYMPAKQAAHLLQDSVAIASNIRKQNERAPPNEISQLTEEFWKDIRKIRDFALKEFGFRYERAKKRVERYESSHPNIEAPVQKPAVLPLLSKSSEIKTEVPLFLKFAKPQPKEVKGQLYLF